MAQMIWALGAVAVLGTVQADAGGYVPLFNGKNLDGWKQYAGKPGLWKVEDGMIVCLGRGGGWLGTVANYSDFDLVLEYRLKPGGNSGVYIRAPEEGRISRTGIEIQVLDDSSPRYKRLRNYQYAGSIYHVVGPSKRATKPAPAWNKIRIRAVGPKIQVWINGEKVVDTDIREHLKNPAVAKEHPGLKRRSGHIGLQSHTDRVEYRNILIKDLAKNQR